MNLDRKMVWASRFGLSCFLFGTLGCWSAGYLFAPVNSDIMELRVCFTTAMINAAFFFSFFAAYRLRTRFNQFKKQLFERTGFDDTSPSKASMKEEVRRLRRFGIVVISLIVFMIFNGFLLHKACSSNNHTRVFLHVAAFVAASFAFDASFLMYSVDEALKKLEELISQYRTDQTSEETRDRKPETGREN